MNTINVENCKTLLIGRRGENEVTTVAFDFTEWATEFGSGVVDLYVKRFGDNPAYPVVLTIDGTIATWTVTATDTNVAGYGKAEYVYRVDGKIAKSAVFPFFVAEDIGQPASEPPDPYESWLEQLTALGAETEANAQAAEQSAENSAESAQEAAGSATSAEGYAGQAETAAGLAQAAQTASEAARDAAQTAQASAESSATAASGSAASAAGSATAAAGSASDASASATAAGASASAAGNAATQAEAAKTAAQNAQSAAEDAAEDAQQAAQQAHVEYEQLSGEVDDLSDEVSQQKSAIEDLQALTNRKAGMLVDSVSGAIASFLPDATIGNLLGVTVDIEPVQDLHGQDAPYPPGGGKNLLENTAASATVSGVTFTVNEDGTVTVNGTATAIVFYNISVQTLEFGEAVIVSGCPAGGSGSAYSLQINNQTLETGNGVTAQSGTAITNVRIRIASGTTCSNLLFKPMIRLATETDATFAPYENRCPISGWDSVNIWNKPTHDTSLPPTVTIQIGQTVYGAKLTIAEGGSVNALVDRVMVDMGSLAWGGRTQLGSAGHYFFYYGIYRDGAKYFGKMNAEVFKTYTQGIPDWEYQDNSALIDNSAESPVLYVRCDQYQDVASFKEAMSGVKLVYELATPIEIQLDPVTISTISGQTNNVWADAGDVSVEFAADLKNYIDSKIAAAVAAMS